MSSTDFTWRANFIDAESGALLLWCDVTEEMVWERLASADPGDRHVAPDGSIRAGAWLFTFMGERCCALGSNAAVCGGESDVAAHLDNLWCAA